MIQLFKWNLFKKILSLSHGYYTFAKDQLTHSHPSQVFYGCDKIRCQKQVGQEASAFTSQVILKESQGRNSKQQPGGRNWHRHQGRMLLTVLYLMASSACFLIQPGITCPGMVLSTVSKALPHQSLNKTIRTRQTCLQANLSEKFSILRLPLPRYSRFVSG